MDTVLWRHRAWLWGMLFAIGGLLVCSGCGDQQQTASSQSGGSTAPKAPGPPGLPPAPPTFNQPSGAPAAGMPSAGTTAGLPGTPGTAGQPGTMPAQGGATVPGVDGQSNAGAPNNVGPATGATPPADVAPSGPPVAGFAVGNIAPEIDGEDLTGEVFRLSEYRGKVVVLDFWGDW